MRLLEISHCKSTARYIFIFLGTRRTGVPFILNLYGFNRVDIVCLILPRFRCSSPVPAQGCRLYCFVQTEFYRLTCVRFFHFAQVITLRSGLSCSAQTVYCILLLPFYFSRYHGPQEQYPVTEIPLLMQLSAVHMVISQTPVRRSGSNQLWQVSTATHAS